MRLYDRVLENINSCYDADRRFPWTGDKSGLRERLELHQFHIEVLQRRVGDLEALAMALLVIIDPMRIVNPHDKRLESYNKDRCCGLSKQEKLVLTDRNDIEADGFLVAVADQPYYHLLSSHKSVALESPPESEPPVYPPSARAPALTHGDSIEETPPPVARGRRADVDAKAQGRSLKDVIASLPRAT